MIMTFKYEDLDKFPLGFLIELVRNGINTGVGGFKNQHKFVTNYSIKLEQIQLAHDKTKFLTNKKDGRLFELKSILTHPQANI